MQVSTKFMKFLLKALEATIIFRKFKVALKLLSRIIFNAAKNVKNK